MHEHLLSLLTLVDLQAFLYWRYLIAYYLYFLCVCYWLSLLRHTVPVPNKCLYKKCSLRLLRWNCIAAACLAELRSMVVGSRKIFFPMSIQQFTAPILLNVVNTAPVLSSSADYRDLIFVALIPVCDFLLFHEQKPLYLAHYLVIFITNVTGYLGRLISSHLTRRFD